MLIQFLFGNYKSFKDEATLDMTPAAINEHMESLITDTDGEKFLPVAVIYGPNGGGKSTTLEALKFFAYMVLRHIMALSSDEYDFSDYSDFEGTNLGDKFYKFDPAYKNIPQSFDVFFRNHGIEFRYQLSVLKSEIIEENLYMRKLGETDAEIVFERSENDIYTGEVLDGVSASKIKNTIPLITYISLNYDIEVINIAVDWFMDLYFIDNDNPLTYDNMRIPKQEKEHRLFYDMLREMDIHISDVRVERDNDNEIKNIYTLHEISGVGMVEIPLNEESGGTRKLFSLLPYIRMALRFGWVVVADEMDAKLHPKLLRYIIELFTNPDINMKGAQLIFTSHDMTTMIPEVFRRDEIWFCALNSENTSHLYSLVSFKKENGSKPRKDETYGKQYLEGRYGADPYLRRLLSWEDIANEQ